MVGGQGQDFMSIAWGLEIAGQILLATVSLFPAFLYFGTSEIYLNQNIILFESSKLLMLGARGRELGVCRLLDKSCWPLQAYFRLFCTLVFQKINFYQNIIFRIL